MITLPEMGQAAAWQALRHDWLGDEAALVRQWLADLPDDWQVAQAQGESLLAAVQRSTPGVRESLLHLFPLTSPEGRVLMQLAEAVLRIPDDATLDRLLHDLLLQGDWHTAAQRAQRWQASIASRLLEFCQWLAHAGDAGRLGEWLLEAGQASIRTGARKAVAALSADFVIGQTIEQALLTADNAGQHRYSFDMLGEAALTYPDAAAYFEAYRQAIQAVALSRRADRQDRSVSIKLSALHPRYEWRNLDQLRHELLPMLVELAMLARELDVPLTLDAEEAERLEVSLLLFEQVFTRPQLADWPWLGLAVQAYSLRAPAVIDWLSRLAHTCGKRIPVRLVKGAYWDGEIKRAQQGGWAGYPVLTSKTHTELAYLICAARLLADAEAFEPQFATHNAWTAAHILQLAQPGGRQIEFQRLHGMGEALHRQLVQRHGMVSRVYAPVGPLPRLLPYLVRRLLENGASNSFVHQLAGAGSPAHDMARIYQTAGAVSPGLPAPGAWFSGRQIATGGSMADMTFLQSLQAEMAPWAQHGWEAAPFIHGHPLEGGRQPRHSPLDTRQQIGWLIPASEAAVDAALAGAQRAAAGWDATPVETRVAVLESLAGRLTEHRGELLALLQLEAGKALPDALAEWREAIDYCYWYARQAKQIFGRPLQLDAVAGERNQLGWHGRGCLVCISPWNFPLAIFVGQVVAALVAGNSVVAKPSQHTSLIAARVTRLLADVGVPPGVLQLVTGEGATLGERLIDHPAVAGVVFTGSAAVASQIQRLLARRQDAIVPLIAETSGVNAMIVDSSAHLEQLVADVMQSAFNSAGQRCSSLRVLCVQDEIAGPVTDLLREAMHTLTVGDVRILANDIGPLISEPARQQLQDYLAGLPGRLLAQGTLSADLPPGAYVAPQLWEIDPEHWPTQETFGPVLHLVRWRQGELAGVVERINRSGFGLTLALHSRLPSHIELVSRLARVGNLYVNRNQIGAVVGCQPFGGEGRSGTGPKAGGPHYLQRLAVERVVSINTAAVGGSPELYREDWQRNADY